MGLGVVVPYKCRKWDGFLLLRYESLRRSVHNPVIACTALQGGVVPDKAGKRDLLRLLRNKEVSGNPGGGWYELQIQFSFHLPEFRKLNRCTGKNWSRCGYAAPSSGARYIKLITEYLACSLPEIIYMLYIRCRQLPNFSVGAPNAFLLDAHPSLCDTPHAPMNYSARSPLTTTIHPSESCNSGIIPCNVWYFGGDPESPLPPLPTRYNATTPARQYTPSHRRY